jgi:hypothetical protein
MTEFKPAAYKSEAYHCPACGAYAHQRWLRVVLKYSGGGTTETNPYMASQCSHCDEFHMWREGKLIFPDTGTAPHPNKDMPRDVKADYDEANTISNRSPRGAAALLRLAIQKLCKHLGQPGKNINDDIAAMVKVGLPESIQQALAVR